MEFSQKTGNSQPIYLYLAIEYRCDRMLAALLHAKVQCFLSSLNACFDVYRNCCCAGENQVVNEPMPLLLPAKGIATS